MTREEEHLRLLSIFHYVVGGLTALFSCIPLIHLAMGIAIVNGVLDGKDAAPRFVGWFFIIFASGFILTGWTLAALIIAAGRKLKRRVARTFCLVVAGIECLIVPFGTVLGVFTIVVLMQDTARELFAAQTPTPDTATSGRGAT
ncbi:MAG: hypothetical protein NTY53_01085 [Kiritimatiellaeota bacterium]|nr:hypothetical protein [Kiritimatiellota bacterium]